MPNNKQRRLIIKPVKNTGLFSKTAKTPITEHISDSVKNIKPSAFPEVNILPQRIQPSPETPDCK